MAEFKRNVAYKVWVKGLLSGTYVKGVGFESGYVPVNGLNVSRVNVIGIIVDKNVNEDSSYVNFVLDDSSGNLVLRAWREDVDVIKDYNIGDCVNVVGKVKDYNGETYVLPEAVRKVELKWMEYRKLELGKISLSNETSVEEKVKEEVVTKVEGEPRAILIDLIEKYDSGDGAEYDSVVVKSGLSEAEAEEVLKDMISQGEIFEVRTGFLKVML